MVYSIVCISIGAVSLAVSLITIRHRPLSQLLAIFGGVLMGHGTVILIQSL